MNCAFKSLSLVNRPALLAAACFAALAPWAHADDSYFLDEEFYDEDIEGVVNIFDPLEGLNRYTFRFNDFLYGNVLEPIVNVYTTLTPDPVEVAAENFFNNLRYPVRLAGNLLQGRLCGAWVETGRFAINSTVGLAGIRRPADRMEAFAPIPAEDIGQALGSWGFGEGAYLVLPLLGPSNIRDFGGLLADRAINPFKRPFSVTDDWNWEWRLAFEATDFITSSPRNLERYERMKGNSIDPYSSMKNGYTQFRRSAVAE